MAELFQPTRADGRSDRRVVFEAVERAEPDTMFTYPELTALLQEGTERLITRPVVGAAVRAANQTLLRECKRTMAVVKNVGYRVAKANEHLGLALYRKDQADHMLQHGVTILRNARLDEMEEPHRTLHRGQLMIMVGLAEAMRTTRRRQDKQEETIRRLLQRVARLEERGESEG